MSHVLVRITLIISVLTLLNIIRHPVNGLTTLLCYYRSSISSCSTPTTKLFSTSSSNSPRPGSLEAATAELGKVPYGESSRIYRRTVYTHSDWVKHRSNDRLLSNLKGVFFSGIIRQLQKEVSLVASIATFVVIWNDYLVPATTTAMTETTTEMIIQLPHLALPLLPFTLSSPALGLLLVFKTNASYQRWLEGRMRWGIITSQTKNMVRMASTFSDTTNVEGQKACHNLARAVWTLNRSIMNTLSGPEDDIAYENELREMYCSNNNEDDDESYVSQLLLTGKNERATLALVEASLVLDLLPVDEKRRVEIDKSFVIIGDALESCRRVFNSPVPLVYTRHTSRFISFWMITLPFAIHDEFVRLDSTGLSAIPAAAILALFLFGIEELSVQLEEPFSILPMQKFCDETKNITRDLVLWSETLRRRRRPDVERDLPFKSS